MAVCDTSLMRAASLIEIKSLRPSESPIGFLKRHREIILAARKEIYQQRPCGDKKKKGELMTPAA
jgi:hypothetical protein